MLLPDASAPVENNEATRACPAGFREAVHALPPPSSCSSSGLLGCAMSAESQGQELQGLRGWNWVRSGKRQRGVLGPSQRLEDHLTQEQQRGLCPAQVNSRASLVGWDYVRPGIAERASESGDLSYRLFPWLPPSEKSHLLSGSLCSHRSSEGIGRVQWFLNVADHH